jgi:hypothetical protein
MAKLVAVFALLALLPVVGEAGTLPGCLPSSLPTVPVPPVFALDTSDRADDNAHLDIWRHACLDGSGSAVLIRLMPTSLAAHVCYVDFSVVQAGTEFRVDLHWSPSGLFLCGTIVAPVTAYLTTWGPAVPFDNTRAFTLVYRDGFARRSVEIPTAGSAPPSIRVVASGCVTCHPGDTLGVDVFVDNPGPSMLVELKTAARLPDDSVVSILERHKEVMLLSAEDLVPGGVMVIPLVADFALPAGIPAGTYTIEAALLEPKLGVTLSRHKVSFTVAP